MDFNRQKADAQTRSRQLIGLFALAVFAVVVVFSGLGALIWYGLTAGSALPDYFVLTNAFVVLLFVVGGAWLESTNLEAGGSVIAHQLGARSPNPYDLRHKRLINIVEEIALAASTPVPQIFVLDHPGINALAAGADPTHAAVVVTEGALDTLTRDELQGVVAHEISHIINGDAAINTRLAGGLYGLYSLHILGRDMMSAAVGYRRTNHRLGPMRREASVFGLLFIPGLLIASVGWFGKFCAHLVQSGVSRQREYLADAQAVQFTRSRDGIGGALRKLSGQQEEPLDSAYAEVVSHLWLHSLSGKSGWFDSHPPLADRVKRIYGRTLSAVRPEILEIIGEHDAAEMAPYESIPFQLDTNSAGAGFVPVTVNGSISRLGGAQQQAEQIRPPDIARHDPNDPKTLLFNAAKNPGTTLSGAAFLLNAIVAGPAAADGEDTASDPALVSALQWLEDPQGQWLRVSLIELLAAQVRDWPIESRRTLVRYCHDAVLADGRVEKTEWIYFTLVRHRLCLEQPVSSRSFGAVDKRKALAEIFSMAEKLSAKSPRAVREAVVQAAADIGISRPAATPEHFRFRSLTRALDVLSTLAPLRKPLLLRALKGLHPDHDATYAAFLDAVAAAIDCPPLARGSLDISQSPDMVQKGAAQPSESHIS